MSRLLPWIFAGLFLGGIAHILSIMAMPALSKSDATTRLRSARPINAMTPLPLVGPGPELIPFSDPNAALGVCPFDLATGPLRIRVGSGGPYLTLAFLQPGGRIFYALSDKANPNGALDVRLATAEQLQAIEADDPDDETVLELRVTSPVQSGVVLIRALAPERSRIAEATRRIAAARCESEPLKP